MSDDRLPKQLLIGELLRKWPFTKHWHDGVLSNMKAISSEYCVCVRVCVRACVQWKENQRKKGGHFNLSEISQASKSKDNHLCKICRCFRPRKCYLTRSGDTKEACGIVAGAAALVLERFPHYTPEEVKQYLVNKATDGAINMEWLLPRITPNKLLYVGNNGCIDEQYSML